MSKPGVSVESPQRNLQEIDIQPAQLLFSGSRQGSGYVSRVTVKNLMSSGSLAFKLKTNAPSRYSVKPVYGLIHPQEAIDIYVRCETELHQNDKFMIQYVTLKESETAEAVNSDFWKTLEKHRVTLRFISCVYSLHSRGTIEPPNLSKEESAGDYKTTKPTKPSKLSQEVSSDSIHAESPVRENSSSPSFFSYMIVLSVIVLLAGLFMPAEWIAEIHYFIDTKIMGYEDDDWSIGVWINDQISWLTGSGAQ